MRSNTRIAGALAAVVAMALSIACSEDGDDNGGTDPILTGSIEATVTGDGAALAGVTVRLFEDGGTSAIETLNTGSNGRATFEDLEAGAYEVEIVVLSGFELAAGQTARRDVNVVAEQTATVSFALQEIVVPPTEGQIRARVVEDGAGVAGVEVRLFTAGGTSALATLTTGTDGRALFAALDPGAYDVEITLPAEHEPAPGEMTRKEVSVTAGATTDVQFDIVGPEPTTVDITLSGTSFTPDDVTIAPGTTVRWIWQSGGQHTVTPDGHGEWSSTVLDSTGEVFEHTFDSTGEFPYFCIPHQSQGMTGIVRVQ